MKEKPIFLELTEEGNALDYLEKACSFIAKTEVEISAWKWVILGVHSALYGFAICALKGTNPDRVTNKRQKLISFEEAISRCQENDHMVMTVISKCLILDQSQKQSIKLLNKLRNKILHYIPMAWYIETHGLPQIILDCLHAIEFLAIESGNYARFTEAEKLKIVNLISDCRQILKSSVIFKKQMSPLIEAESI